ncbi:hypothetical protein CBR_g40969 [Chara braunii]|uniref:EDRF1 N-terminal domain-containing protein n=1 Tax=Chara braunii TaxID=69332 RepID=A0A388LUS2_CHABU|nr:hypothetical protein CBR_g40969 [Chara braunii]|eukprot:GBG86068.1 hypothetical protein CBR_g40969 [Chara braunii]
MSEQGGGGGGGGGGGRVAVEDRRCGMLSFSPGMADIDVVPVACLPLVKPQPGFICGTLPVPTDGGSYADLVRNKTPPTTVVRDRESIPRCKFLPTETDLNDAPPNLLEGEGNPSQLDPEREADDWSNGGYLRHPLARSGEALAVSGLARYGDEVDVIAPAEILKQIFKTPYSKARVSVAVHRVGRTLILNSGPDVGANEKAARRKRGQASAAERALFSNFIHHSVHTPSASTTGPPSQESSSFHGINGFSEPIPDCLERESCHGKAQLDGCDDSAVQQSSPKEGRPYGLADPNCDVGTLHSHAERMVQRERGERQGPASQYGDAEEQSDQQCEEDIVVNSGRDVDLAPPVVSLNGTEESVLRNVAEERVFGTSDLSERQGQDAGCHFTVGGAESGPVRGYLPPQGYVREIDRSGGDRVMLSGGKWPRKKKGVDRGMGRRGKRKGSLGRAQIGNGGPHIVGAVVDERAGSKAEECGGEEEEGDNDKGEEETGAEGGRGREREDPRLEGFSRVLFWQFEELRLLLGSDLLLFSNERHAAVSLHLLELEHQATPITWLDAWLDNVMASVPELAVCYHRKGVVQGYELLKTDDILLLKGLTGDGRVSFHPHVVQKNASSVLQFLQENCTRDPGTYWLFKNSGEDLMQLFDLSMMSTRGSPPTSPSAESESLDDFTTRKKGKKNRYSLPLAMLCYRLAKRLSLSKDPLDKRKCANLFAKCVDLIDEEEQPCVRATAHEEAARLMLACCNEPSLARQSLPSCVPEDSAQADLHTTALQLSPLLPAASDCVVVLGQRGGGGGSGEHGHRMKSKIGQRAVKVLPSGSSTSTSVAVTLKYAEGERGMPEQPSQAYESAMEKFEQIAQAVENQNAHEVETYLSTSCNDSWGSVDGEKPMKQHSVDEVASSFINKSLVLDVKPTSRLAEWESVSPDLPEVCTAKEESQDFGDGKDICHAIIPSSGPPRWAAALIPDLGGKRSSGQQDEEDSQSGGGLARHVSWSQTHYMSKWLSVPTDAVSAHLAAIHHLSQAIKVLRWQRQVVEERRKAKAGGEVVDGECTVKEVTARRSKGSSEFLALCLCGESACAPSACSKETTQKMERKVLQLIRLLGESYLALAQAYQSDGQLGRALRAAELAGLVCGPLQEMDKHPLCLQAWIRGKKGAGKPYYQGMRLPCKRFEKKEMDGAANSALALSLSSSFCKGKGVVSGKEGRGGSRGGSDEALSFWKGQFWGSLWAFVGDIYVEVQQTMSEGDLPCHQDGSNSGELTIEDEVVKEVKRLKKKSGPPGSGCSSCSLTGCSCLSDRASSGRSASVSGSSGSREGSVTVGILRRHSRRRHIRKGRSEKEFDDDDDDDQDEDEDEEVSVERVTGSKQAKTVSAGGNRGADRRMHKTDKNLESAQQGHGQGDGERVIVGDEDDRANKPCNGGDACFGRQVTLDWRVNLTAADECYAAAVMAVSELPECREEWELALRKRGWTCNELGRRWLVAGERELAEQAFRSAIVAFRAVGDVTNEVLVHCNLGHARRAAAEKAVSELQEAANHKEEERGSQVAEGDEGEESMSTRVWMEGKWKQASAMNVTALYGEALGHYCAARKALLLVGDGVEKSFGGVWNEVHTQMAHTYLRLGMFLAAESRLLGTGATGRQPDNGSKEGASCDRDKGRMSALGGVREEHWDFIRRLDGLSPKEAITKAIVLYESLGKSRTQEAAYASYQLASYHRDCCMAAIPLRTDTKGKDRSHRGGGGGGGGGGGIGAGRKVQAVPSYGSKFSGNNARDGEEALGTVRSWQLARRYAALAEVHWQKALEVYRPHLHPDMFAGILIDMSALCLACAPHTYPNDMLDAALAHLLDARHAFTSAVQRTGKGKREIGAIVHDGDRVLNNSGDTEGKQTSQEVIGRLHAQLLKVLRQMLATAITTSNKAVVFQTAGSPTAGSNSTIGENGKHRGTAAAGAGGDATRGRGLAAVSTGGAVTSCEATRREKDCQRLREMYRRALKLGIAIDLGDLHRIWTSAEP